jgi:UDP-2,3-diacylglucosamine pyrophosphatase LpxH
VLYVISDLHLGGEWPGEAERGFRMMTRVDALAGFVAAREAELRDGAVELVINGDFVDFLAERPPGSPHWVPFRHDPDEAAAALDRVVQSDRVFFDALASFVAAGGALTIILGNHDVELALPQVRARLDRALGTHHYRFVHDGESYWPADNLVIEHGDRFDPANAVDHAGLHQLRRHLSRGRRAGAEDLYTASPGSRLVADVMNPLKRSYRFIDLLKPESEALFALLLALEPDARGYLGKLACALAPVPMRAARQAVLGDIGAAFGHDSAAFDGNGAAFDDTSEAPAAPSPDEALLALLATTVPDPALALAVAAEGGGGVTDIGVGDWIASKLALVNLLLRGAPALDERLGAVQQALRAIEGDRTFDPGFEPSRRFLRGAAELARAVDARHHPHVVFGHTHHAKAITWPETADTPAHTYLNTGTWANLMQFPASLVDADASIARAALHAFVQDLADDRDDVRAPDGRRPLDKYLLFRPTYVRAVIDDGVATDVNLYVDGAR